jgi:hypothetical protein
VSVAANSIGIQSNAPVETEEELLLTEERHLSVLRWIAESIPYNSRWYLVFIRYLQHVAAYVHLETELWERDEILSIIKYEPYKRNKAALSLLWDLDARNHEATLLKIKHIRLREKYGEGEIPYESKTGTGPTLLTCSFPYVRDWLNEHPFRNEANARLICNLMTGGSIKPDSLCTRMVFLEFS